MLNLGKQEIYITQSADNSKCQLVIQGDDHSVYAYFLNNSGEVEFDGFLCSRGTLVESSEEVRNFIENSQNPPLTKSFANEFSIHEELVADDISIDWQKNIIRISIKQIEYLIFDLVNKKAYSKSIKYDGPYGLRIEDYSDLKIVKN